MNTNDLLIDWCHRVRRAQVAHYHSAVYFERLNFWLGMPVVMLTTVVGTSVFASLQKEPDTWIKIAVGLASVLAAVLAGVHTFLRYSERAEKHRAVAVKYGALRREIEQRVAVPNAQSDNMEGFIKSVRIKWDKLNEDAPTTPRRIWERVGAKQRAEREAQSKELE